MLTRLTASALAFNALNCFFFLKPYSLHAQKLKHEDLFDDLEERERLTVRRRSWFKFRRVHIRKRFRLRVPGLRRLLRKKGRLVSAVRLSCAKVAKRFKEGQGHFGDLFAGNYLFLQINPSSLKQLQKSYYGTAGFNIDGFSSKAHNSVSFL